MNIGLYKDYAGAFYNEIQTGYFEQTSQKVPLSQEIKVAALVILEEKLCEVYTKEAESHNAHALDNAQ